MMCIQTFKMINLCCALLVKKRERESIRDVQHDKKFIFGFFLVLLSTAMGTLVYIEVWNPFGESGLDYQNDFTLA